VVWVRGVPQCAKIHYRTCTHTTRFGKPAGFPVPVPNPNDEENGDPSLIWLYHNNQTKICQSLIWNMIHTYRSSGYQQYLHICWLEHLLWLNHILSTLFFRNMALTGHTGKILKL
jgi:hypothetical protein